VSPSSLAYASGSVLRGIYVAAAESC
jgi:hypothetical protein